MFVEPFTVGERICYAHQHSDGRIVLWTDRATVIWLWTKVQPNPSTSGPSARYNVPSEISTRVAAVMQQCLSCHVAESRDVSVRVHICIQNDSKL